MVPFEVLVWFPIRLP